MSDTNKCEFSGRLGADPEMRYSAGGTAIANFNLAVSESRKNKAGGWDNNTMWIRVVCFKDLAESAGELSKGARVSVVGKLQTRSWEGKDGAKKSMTELVANSLQVLDGKGKNTEPVPDDIDGVPF